MTIDDTNSALLIRVIEIRFTETEAIAVTIIGIETDRSGINIATS